MCDCYWTHCEDEACDRHLAVHISDFAFSRDSVQVRCWAHPPPVGEARWEAFIALGREEFDARGEDNEPEFPVMWIRCMALQHEWPSEHGICPNTGVPTIEARLAAWPAD